MASIRAVSVARDELINIIRTVNPSSYSDLTTNGKLIFKSVVIADRTAMKKTLVIFEELNDDSIQVNWTEIRLTQKQLRVQQSALTKS